AAAAVAAGVAGEPHAGERVGAAAEDVRSAAACRRDVADEGAVHDTEPCVLAMEDTAEGRAGACVVIAVGCDEAVGDGDRSTPGADAGPRAREAHSIGRRIVVPHCGAFDGERAGVVGSVRLNAAALSTPAAVHAVALDQDPGE